MRVFDTPENLTLSINPKILEVQPSQWYQKIAFLILLKKVWNNDLPKIAGFRAIQQKLTVLKNIGGADAALTKSALFLLGQNFFCQKLFS